MLPISKKLAGIEVRSTHHVDGHLIIKPKDRDGMPVVLVITARRPDFRVAGWMWAKEGKVPRWRRPGHGGSWWVPQHALRPMSELRDLLGGATEFDASGDPRQLRIL